MHSVLQMCATSCIVEVSGNATMKIPNARHMHNYQLVCAKPVNTRLLNPDPLEILHD